MWVPSRLEVPLKLELMGWERRREGRGEGLE